MSKQNEGVIYHYWRNFYVYPHKRVSKSSSLKFNASLILEGSLTVDIFCNKPSNKLNNVSNECI